MGSEGMDGFFLRLCAAGLLSIMFCTAPMADTIRGSDDPRFQSALNTWLDGEDEYALQALASLAREENRAAQILLAQIEGKVWLHEHVTTKLNRKDRIGLLRNPKGLSGRSWLLSAAKDTALAQYLFDAKGPYELTAVGKGLFAQGELGEALSLIGRARDGLGNLELALNDRALPYSTGMAHEIIEGLPSAVKWRSVAADDPRFEALQKKLPDLPAVQAVDKILWNSGAFLHEIHPRSEAFLSIGEELVALPDLMPIVEIVARHCPKDAPRAMAALQVAQAGIPLTLSVFSPVELFLPSELYQYSRRFEADILRRIGHTIYRKDNLVGLNACAATVVSKTKY